MPESWTAPFTASPGNVVSSSDHNAGVRGNLLYLRQFLSANPAGNNLALIATGTDSAGWSTVPDAALALKYVRGATPLASSFTALQVAGGNGFFEVESPGTGGPAAGVWYCFNLGETNQPTNYGCQIAVDINNQDEIYFHNIIGGVAGTWRKMFHAGNDTRAGVPSGLIAAFRTAAAIASGWARCDGDSGRPELDGRIIVGAGTSFSVTYTEDTNGGSSWSHDHAAGAHTHGVTATGTSGGPSGTSTRLDGSNAVASDSHTHTLSVTGTAAAGSGNTAGTAWTIPHFVAVYAIKS